MRVETGYEPDEVDISRSIYRYLSSDGTATGTKDMATTADDYFFQNVQRYTAITRLIVSYQDGSGGTDAEYGNLNAALSNGITVHVDSAADVELLDLTDGVPITFNAGWGALCFDYAVKNQGSAANDLWVIRWTFERSGRPLLLKPGEKLVMSIQDDLTNLVNHYAMAQGYYLC